MVISVCARSHLLAWVYITVRKTSQDPQVRVFVRLWTEEIIKSIPKLGGSEHNVLGPRAQGQQSMCLTCRAPLLTLGWTSCCFFFFPLCLEAEVIVAGCQFAQHRTFLGRIRSNPSENPTTRLDEQQVSIQSFLLLKPPKSRTHWMGNVPELNATDGTARNGPERW